MIGTLNDDRLKEKLRLFQAELWEKIRFQIQRLSELFDKYNTNQGKKTLCTAIERS